MSAIERMAVALLPGADVRSSLIDKLLNFLVPLAASLGRIAHVDRFAREQVEKFGI